MIRVTAVLHVAGVFLLVLAGTMLFPLTYSFLNPGESPGPLLYGALATGACGLALWRGLRRPASELSVREGVLLVGIIWACLCWFGGLPFYFSPYFGSFTDSFFEAASGFTTTGATILDRVEVLPDPLQLCPFGAVIPPGSSSLSSSSAGSTPRASATSRTVLPLS